LAGLAAGEERAPVVGLDLDIETLGGGLGALPRLVTVPVADPLDLVEAGTADVPGSDATR
jgi:hypothetical protein